MYNKKCFLPLLLIFAVLNLLFPHGAFADSSSNVNEPILVINPLKENSINDIKAKWKVYQPTFKGNKYIKETSPVKPYGLGQLHKDYIEDAVKMSNFVRYLTGLPDDLVQDEELNKSAQHAAVLVNKLGYLTHYPKQPENMPNEFYEAGYDGASSSNLSSGHSSLSDSIKNGYMPDKSKSNIAHVGHRLWILNPPLKKVGFGESNYYSAMKVFDKSRIKEVDYSYITWPSNGNFPLEFFGIHHPWSITLNPEVFQFPDTSDIEISITRLSDNYEWNINHKHEMYSERQNYLSTYGSSIIFRPGLAYPSFKSGDKFKVEITGLKDWEDNPLRVNYQVNFFSLNPTNDAPYEVDYADLDPKEYWYENMKWAIDTGLISGYQYVFNPKKNTYEHFVKPYSNLTEGQFLTVLFRLVKYDELLRVVPAFPEFWADEVYQLAFTYDIPTKASFGNQGAANASITRGELAVMLASYHFGKNVSEKEGIEFMYSAGLSNGYPDKNGNYPKTVESYDANQTLKRAHIVTFMKNYDKYLNKGN